VNDWNWFKGWKCSWCWIWGSWFWRE